MKKIFLLLTLVVLGGMQAARAQACDVSTLTGPFAYSASGFFTNGAFGAGRHVFSASGRLAFDAQGHVNVKDTESVDGNVTRGQTFSGAYTMSSDCTGSITLFSPSSGTLFYDFTLASTGNELVFVGGSSSANITGSAKKQTVATVQ